MRRIDARAPQRDPNKTDKMKIVFLVNRCLVNSWASSAHLYLILAIKAFNITIMNRGPFARPPRERRGGGLGTPLPLDPGEGGGARYPPPLLVAVGA